MPKLLMRFEVIFRQPDQVIAEPVLNGGQGRLELANPCNLVCNVRPDLVLEGS